MRVVRKRGELGDALAAAQREAKAAFGDARVFLEKYVERARHVEIQVFGDTHGNIVHCFERASRRPEIATPWIRSACSRRWRASTRRPCRW
jgi:acetyl/propionyl-CoA carboxylase alpha subunit